MATLSLAIRFRVLERDRYTCRYCGRSAPEVVLEVDHIIPTSAGGNDKLENLCVACRDCNGGKRDTLIEADWLERMRTAGADGRGLFIVQLYCGNSSCAAREVTVRVKDHESNAVDTLKRRGKAKCPFCGQTCKMHWAMSFRAYYERECADARRSVNVQRYERDHGPVIPGDVMDDDTLPKEPYARGTHPPDDSGLSADSQP